ncbi:SDR family oxidoreductase [Antrihabitans cavernicola]|uniref:SDR family oxidoreductase n=1 Tax=Antrihabitans cavernicola TaxID=2495913 RepID=A0A5A7S6P4_9NOCA|nr:SDR family oxidoreductase [Spelaeibacter cavernicola]KAA0020060.1 SDR family oxidoreductase [Spelaeibacter cavernicola]
MSAGSDRAPKVAVVTGAGTGLGREITRAFLDAGFAVALAGRRREQLVAAAADHPRAVVVPTDVSDADSVTALFDTVSAKWGRVDVLVNNAGTFGPSGSVDEIDPVAWSDTVAVNLTGAFLCAAAAVRAMKAQEPRGGRIINNGSISANTPRPGSVAYTATKHAITGLTKSISLDGRGFDIACGQIDIGNAATDMTAGIASGVRQADGSIKSEPTFDARHAAAAVLSMAELPLDVNVQFITLMATEMPYVGRG